MNTNINILYILLWYLYIYIFEEICIHKDHKLIFKDVKACTCIHRHVATVLREHGLESGFGLTSELAFHTKLSCISRILDCHCFCLFYLPQ
jgi:hypothetical protein